MLSHRFVTEQWHTDWKACIISFLASAAEWAAVCVCVVFFFTLLCGYKWNLCSASELNALHGADFITAQDCPPVLMLPPTSGTRANYAQTLVNSVNASGDTRVRALIEQPFVEQQPRRCEQPTVVSDNKKTLEDFES